MRNGWAVAPLAAVLGFASACATLETHVDYDLSARFSQYRTFDVQVMTGATPPFVERRFENAVRQALESKGLTYSRREPDLVARISAVVVDQPRPYVGYWGWGGWWGWDWGWGWGWRWWGPWPGPADVVHVPVGALTVDLVDSKTNDPVWRGTATDFIREKWTPERAEAEIHLAMEELFRGFPPRSRGR